MQTRPLGQSGLDIVPLVFGGNVFGWTVDEATSFALLDALVDAGINAIDTADVYSVWVDGHTGGESETIIGKWLAANPAKRDKVLILTKVGAPMRPDDKGLKAGRIERCVEASLRRLQTDRIDLYQAHYPDAGTPQDETLEAFNRLVTAGKVRAIGASNFNPAQLAEALDISTAGGLARYEALQPEYNLYDRSGFEGELRDLCIARGLGVIPYFSLASGFLSGKYRSEADLSQSQRGSGVGKYLNPRGFAILAALDNVAAAHDASPAEVALAWMIASPGVTAPIASATSLGQLAGLVRSLDLVLTPEEMTALDAAGA
ncbi:NADP-dependent aryl-alcohol dehydrogenase [Tistrella bauzanensis]|uniref:NADP-dependent aryl-alcohol dehydrogenase n=1 Tax=Tistrella bauzanensis TaxID=657419 RepID=A0ABQ1ISL4_9PROT|nr:aldo/keto reductase [Tistrella bauzanensis]GGB50230.1 NADP-dependent aryl-alcohol dehydrogenase [Tistrella bauzanensis]